MPSTIDISNLSTAERLDLIEELWESLSVEAQNLPLTAAQGTEIDRRLALLESDPDRTESWESAESWIQERL